MQVDFRRTTLSNINHIQTLLERLKGTDSSRVKEGIIASIKANVDLFKNDVILILNQNFYLNCKLTEKQKMLQQLQKKCQSLEESGKLHLHMAKMKYQKYIHNLKYQLFSRGKQSTNTELLKDLAQCLDSQPYDFSLPTPKKTVNLKDTHLALDQKQTLFKPKTSIKVDEEEQKEKIFDLQVRFQGVKSQQIPYLTPTVMKEALGSQAETEEESKNRRKKRGGSDRVKIEEEQERKENNEGMKSELAKLVAQQFKIPPIKQKYFSTDIL